MNAPVDVGDVTAILILLSFAVSFIFAPVFVSLQQELKTAPIAFVNTLLDLNSS